MITSYTSLTSITEDTSLVLDEIVAKGSYTVQFVLTGVLETVVSALDLDLDWGDGSKAEYYSKELVYNYYHLIQNLRNNLNHSN